MKFVPIFDELTNALNFRTSISQVIGGCDLYTTKATGSDKKLYKKIERELETKYQDLLKHAVAVPPPDDEISPMSLLRASPFGPLSQSSNLRTYAYLIATLNASHPDYNFSHFLRPNDFRRELSLKAVISTINSSICHLRSSSEVNLQAPPMTDDPLRSYVPSPMNGWCSNMWMIIDKEMVLQECAIYCWAPEEEPFDQEDSPIWSLNYFFFNKELKRVTYFYVRLVSLTSEINEYHDELVREFRNHNDFECGVSKGKKRLSNLYTDPSEDDAFYENEDFDTESN